MEDDKIVKDQQESAMLLLQSIVNNKDLYDSSVYSTLVMNLSTVTKELNSTRTKLITGNLNENEKV